MCWQRHEPFHRSQQADLGARRATVRPPDDLLVSDADRQVVIDELREHTADGRLTLDEFEERVDEALRARTGAQLRMVTRDLPALHPVPSAPQRPALRLPVPPRLLVIATVVAVAILAGVWWVIFPLWFVFGGCGAFRSHHTYEPRASAREDDAATTYV